MKKNEKIILLIISLVSGVFAFSKRVQAMHIMEGYLPKEYCVLWGVICIPFLVAGYFNLKKIVNQHRKTILILAMAGAYTFVLSALKIPSLTGSSSHPTGTGLGAILFGPMVMSILGLIVLIFQAVLLAHGGITTLGANTFSMAIVGPIVSYLIYRICLKMKLPKMVCIFIGAAIGDLATYCMTALQLSIAYPSEVGGIQSSFIKFSGIFAVTQVPLAVIEGILTVLVIMTLESYANQELKEIGFIRKSSL